MIDSIILNPDNTKSKIDKLYAVISIKESGEGISAFATPQTSFQSVTSEEFLAIPMYKTMLAQKIDGVKFELREFVFSRVIA